MPDSAARAPHAAVSGGQTEMLPARGLAADHLLKVPSKDADV
jgi:hypothetical protein